MFLLWIVTLEYCYGALLVKMPAICAKSFGSKGGASAYPVLKTAFTLVQFGLVIFNYYLVDYLNYQICFFIMAGFAFVSLFFLMLF